MTSYTLELEDAVIRNISYLALRAGQKPENLAAKLLTSALSKPIDSTLDDRTLGTRLEGLIGIVGSTAGSREHTAGGDDCENDLYRFLDASDDKVLGY